MTVFLFLCINILVAIAFLNLGYSLGIKSERKRNNIRVRYVPMEVKWREAAPGSEPKLPDLSRWKRGGRR